MMEWSEMLPEVLGTIAQKYITCYEDYPSFAGVCKSWRLAAARTYRNSNGPPSRLPCLMLEEKNDDHESREFFLLSNNSIRKIRLPEVSGEVCLSSCGWLLTVGKDFASQLINPLSCEIINLPKVDTFQETIYPLKWNNIISRVVLSMESKLVVVTYGVGKLGFCRIGDNKWTSYVHQQPFTDFIMDFTFYNGQVYTLDCTHKIQACNANGKHPTVLVDVATVPQDEDEDEVEDEDEDEAHNWSSRSYYIAGLDDGERKQLLVIIRSFKFVNTKRFKVFAYDLEGGNWSKVKDFGKKTLFVGCNSPFFIEDTTGVIKGNCIYYRDDGYADYFDSKIGRKRDMGIYHLSDGTNEPHFTGESRSRVTPTIWLQSM